MFVASLCRVLAMYAGAASSDDGGDARVGGQMCGAFEPGDVAGDGRKDLACGPDRDSGHAGQDRALQQGLDLGGELLALFAQLVDAGGEHRDDLLDGLGAGHGHALLADGVEQVVDDAVTASESCTFGPIGPRVCGPSASCCPALRDVQATPTLPRA